MVRLGPLSAEEAEVVRLWRNKNPEGARTPYMLTREQQQDWYQDVVCNRESRHRYWGVHSNGPHEDVFVGLSGITNIEHENRRGEIALLIDPQKRGGGLGRSALLETLRLAFGNMDLEQVYGECYLCNASLPFWTHLAVLWGWDVRSLPSIKRWNGRRWDSFWFAISQETWANME